MPRAESTPPGKRGRPFTGVTYPVLLHFRASREDAERLAAVCRATHQTPTMVLRRLLSHLGCLDEPAGWDAVQAALAGASAGGAGGGDGGVV